MTQLNPSRLRRTLSAAGLVFIVSVLLLLHSGDAHARLPLKVENAVETSLVTTTEDGSAVYLAGTFTGTVDFGGSSLQSEGGADIYVAKYDSVGTLQWVMKGGGVGDERLDAIVIDATIPASIYIAGGFGIGTAVGARFGTHLEKYNAFYITGGSLTDGDIFLARIDETPTGDRGEWTWAQQWGSNWVNSSADGEDRVTDIVLNGDSVWLSGVLGGFTNTQFDFNNLLTPAFLDNPEGNLGFLARIEKNQALLGNTVPTGLPGPALVFARPAEIFHPGERVQPTPTEPRFLYRNTGTIEALAVAATTVVIAGATNAIQLKDSSGGVELTCPASEPCTYHAKWNPSSGDITWSVASRDWVSFKALALDPDDDTLLYLAGRRTQTTSFGGATLTGIGGSWQRPGSEQRPPGWGRSPSRTGTALRISPSLMTEPTSPGGEEIHLVQSGR